MIADELKTANTTWEKVQIARHPDRPHFMDFLEGFSGNDYEELHGDRLFGDDPAMFGGLAMIDGQRVVIIGPRKGRTTEEKIHNRFGMANPEGYRKALRLMKLAEKFRLPVLTVVDTSGAYPGADAEARGQAEAIARNLAEMSTLRTPIVVLVTGEGGSGGALGIAVGDRILMLEHAIYSVISPEGCASILWRDGALAPTAAEALKLTSGDLKALGIIDQIVPEPASGAHTDRKTAIENAKKAVLAALKELVDIDLETLVNARYSKFSEMGR